MPNTFEYDFAQRWKQLYDLEKQQREQLEVQIGEARERLQDEEQFAIQEWHAQQLRQGGWIRGFEHRSVVLNIALLLLFHHEK